MRLAPTLGSLRSCSPTVHHDLPRLPKARSPAVIASGSRSRRTNSHEDHPARRPHVHPGTRGAGTRPRQARPRREDRRGGRGHSKYDLPRNVLADVRVQLSGYGPFASRSRRVAAPCGGSSGTGSRQTRPSARKPGPWWARASRRMRSTCPSYWGRGDARRGARAPAARDTPSRRGPRRARARDATRCRRRSAREGAGACRGPPRTTMIRPGRTRVWTGDAGRGETRGNGPESRRRRRSVTPAAKASRRCRQGGCGGPAPAIELVRRARWDSRCGSEPPPSSIQR
jgi:hypothetical protein